jgi:hypothetical protein
MLNFIIDTKTTVLLLFLTYIYISQFKMYKNVGAEKGEKTNDDILFTRC